MTRSLSMFPNGRANLAEADAYVRAEAETDAAVDRANNILKALCEQADVPGELATFVEKFVELKMHISSVQSGTSSYVIKTMDNVTETIGKCMSKAFAVWKICADEVLSLPVLAARPPSSSRASFEEIAKLLKPNTILTSRTLLKDVPGTTSQLISLVGFSDESALRLW